MKYGDTLQQRSIPEWGAYNVDYNEIKHFIKVRTTRDQAQAISIPGQEYEGRALREFENELYAELCEQHQRVDLFVQSKAGEIKRKLNHLHKQVVQLARHNIPGEQSRISIRRLQRCSKIEEAVLKAGEEIQSLSRFVGAQRVAFQKLLKKYKKWTGSSKLGRRFQRDVLGRPSSFSPDNFELLLAEWTDVLAAVRAPFKAGVTWKTGTDDRRGSAALIPATSECRVSTDAGRAEDECRKPSQVSSSVTELHDTTEGGTCLDLDTALATLPLGRAAGTASYWVHPDNIVELHVLLLQYTRLRNERIYSSNSSIPTSSRQSRRTSVNGQGSSPSGGTEDDVGHVVLDDLENFGKGQSGATASDVENDVGRRSEKAAASIRYCAGGGAVIVATTSPESSKPGSRSKSRVQKAKLKRKHLPSLFDPDLTPPSSHRSIDELTHSTTNQKSNPAQDLENMRRWLARHQEVQPLVELQYKRTRFVGLGNNTTRGLWATLDKDVTMRKASVRQLGGFEGLPTLSEGDGELTGVDRFPYALLDIRWGGDSGANLVRALDQSHLTERVRGFSLEAHAVAVLCKPKYMQPPSWLPALSRDIRKVPLITELPRRRSSAHHSSLGSASTRSTSISATSTIDGPSSSDFSALAIETPSTSVPDMLESPPLRAFKKKGHKLKQHSLRKQINQSAHSQYQRYWNEFDDGDGNSDNETYTILVDPDSSNNFPGAASISRLAGLIMSIVELSTQKITEWLSPHSKASNDVRRLLKDDQSAPWPESEDSDLDEDDSSAEHPYQPRRYSTFPGFDHPVHQAFQNREALLFRLYIAAFATSFILLFIAVILAASARGNAALPADLGLLVGVIAALASSVAAIGLMYAREDPLSWLHKITALLAFVLVCIGSGVLLAVVGSG